jgi:CheY-like chemotaxis protein
LFFGKRLFTFSNLVSFMATKILNGWKEISQHLGRGVRTVQRWEALGLPIRRPNARNRSAVVALSGELEEWLARPEGKMPHSFKSGTSNGVFRYRTLVVDDNESLLVTRAGLLAQEGYDVRTARDGFEALAAMRAGVPDLLVSDLRMPNMSGFELLGVVRRRFPGVGVIATSGEFSATNVPQVFCDCYLENAAQPSILIETARELLSKSPLRAPLAKMDMAPAWIPKSTAGYVVLTCLSCLRSFSVAIRQIEVGRISLEECIHCGIDVRYCIDEVQVPGLNQLLKSFKTPPVDGESNKNGQQRVSADSPLLQKPLLSIPRTRSGTG